LLQATIQSRIAASSTLTPSDIAARAQSLTCAGCHHFSGGSNLEGGIVFPFTLGFVHQSESAATMENSPDGGLRFPISPALDQVFLVHRAQVLRTFLGI
jgi:hypothetical protein